MCLIVFAYKVYPDNDLILLANRDEFRSRNFKLAHVWGKKQRVISGIDLTANGTWTGITDSGRMAVITNFRRGLKIDLERKSRGKLASNFLDSEVSALDYLAEVRKSKGDYNGFNLLFGDSKDLIWYSNVEDSYQVLTPGIYGLSNNLLDVSWPKLEEAKSKLNNLLDQGVGNPEQLLPIMLNKERYPQSKLPDTGIDPELEHALSPIFVDIDSYGTVLTTLIYLSKHSVKLIEYNHLDGSQQLSSCFSSKLFSFETGLN